MLLLKSYKYCSSSQIHSKSHSVFLELPSMLFSTAGFCPQTIIAFALLTMYIAIDGLLPYRGLPPLLQPSPSPRLLLVVSPHPHHVLCQHHLESHYSCCQAHGVCYFPVDASQHSYLVIVWTFVVSICCCSVNAIVSTLTLKTGYIEFARLESSADAIHSAIVSHGS